ncbi:hypothetical protein PLESTM_000714300 [Pleodorina starrii]|nr:hypothetical protein PLESTM_000714300 [Pleodorina starrii]
MQAAQSMPGEKRRRDDDESSSGGSEGERPQLLDAEREPRGGGDNAADDPRRCRRRRTANAAAFPAERSAGGDAGGGSQQWAAQGGSGAVGGGGTAAGAGGGPGLAPLTAAAGASASDDQPGGSGSGSGGNGGSGLSHAAGAAGGGIGSDDPASLPELFMLSSSSDGSRKGGALCGSLALRLMYPTEVQSLDNGGASSTPVQLFRQVGGQEQMYNLTLRLRPKKGGFCLVSGGMQQLKDDLGLKNGGDLRVTALPSGRKVVVADGAAAGRYCCRVRLNKSDFLPRAHLKFPFFQVEGMLGPATARKPGQHFEVLLDPREATIMGSCDLPDAKLTSSEIVSRADNGDQVPTWGINNLGNWLSQQLGAKKGDFVRFWVVEGSTGTQQQQGHQQQHQQEGEQEQPLVIYFRLEEAAATIATAAAGAGGGAAAGGPAAGQPPQQLQQQLQQQL